MTATAPSARGLPRHGATRSTQNLKGLDVVRDSGNLAQSVPGLLWLEIDGFPRFGLTVTEAAHLCRKSYDWMLGEIHAGRIKVLEGGNSYVIPIAETVAIMNRAKYLDPTA